MSSQAFADTYRMFERQLSDADRRACAGRVIYPHGYIVENMLGEELPSDSLSEEKLETLLSNMRMMSSFTLGTWINNVWGIDKTIALYSPKEIRALTNTYWWRACKTDYVIEQFSHGMIYVSLNGLSDPTGNEALYEGVYAGLDYFEDKVCLALLHVTKQGRLDPFYLHEFDLTPGKTLGEVVDEYRYASPYRPYVEYVQRFKVDKEVTKERFETLMKLSGEAMANRVFPLVLGLISGDFEVRPHELDVRTLEFQAAAEIAYPKHDKSSDPVEEVNAAVKKNAMIFYLQQKRHDKAKLN